MSSAGFLLPLTIVLVALPSGAALLPAQQRTGPPHSSHTERPARRALLQGVPALVLPMLLPKSAHSGATGGGFAAGQFAPTGGGPPKQPELAKLTKGEPGKDELKRLQYGYQRLDYLLKNWEQETTVCIKGCYRSKSDYENCGCTRNPIVVQEYMGYKSMNDPLFKAGAGEAEEQARPL